MSTRDNRELSRLIGEVARHDVFLEGHLRMLWLSIAGASLTHHLVPNDLNRLADDCRLMLKHLKGLTTEQLTAGVAALEDAKEAHERRNRVVHDMWMPHEAADAWEVQRYPRRGIEEPAVRQRTIADVGAVDLQILRSVQRIRCLSLAIRPQLGDWTVLAPQLIDPPEILSARWEVVADDFDLVDGAGARPHSWSNRPAGECL
jgi:hypothetical protein